MYESSCVDWYSDHCYICLDVFSKDIPRYFKYNCKHCICLQCSTTENIKDLCYVCDSTENPIMSKQPKNMQIYNIGVTDNSCIVLNITKNVSEDNMQKHFINKKTISRKNNKCCIIS